MLILNPDTVATPHAVGALAAFMDANPRVGIVGSQLEGLDGAKQCSAFRFPSLISELESTMRLGIISRVFDRWRVPLKTRGYPFRVDWVSGASFMVRASLFRQIGLLDEAFFLYFEEVDFCKQAQKAGWECWQVPESRVAHMPGQSTGVSVIDRRPERRPAYWFESRRRYFVKNHGWLYAVLVDLLWMLGHSACRLKQVLLRRPNEAPPHLLWDFVRYSNLVQAVRLWRRVGNHPVRAGRE